MLVENGENPRFSLGFSRHLHFNAFHSSSKQSFTALRYDVYSLDQKKLGIAVRKGGQHALPVTEVLFSGTDTKQNFYLHL
jgi:hypothetical protein